MSWFKSGSIPARLKPSPLLSSHVDTGTQSGGMHGHEGCILQTLRAINFDSDSTDVKVVVQPKGAIGSETKNRPKNK
jgi:hypothetical protein